MLSSGTLGQEQKFIRRSLDESPDIELDYEQLNLKQRDRWPVNLSSRLRLEDYDVFVIGDLDARAVRTEDWQTITQLVDDGRGLMMYGGYHSFGPGGYSDTPLSNVLPIEMNRFEREPDPAEETRTDRHLEGELVMLPDANQPHPVMYLASESENEPTWRELKPLRGANKFERVKERTTVIARSNRGDPLLVASTYVTGRVLAFAGDSTYRWYKYGKPDVHRRFWRQAILWLARRDKQQANSVFIDLPQRRFQSRREVRFITGLTDEVGDTVIDATLRATLTLPDGQTQEIPLSRNGDPTTNGSVGVVSETEAAGDYRITVEAFDGDQPITSTYREFTVEKKDFELSDPAANPGLLEMLAGMTSRVGGRVVAPEQLPSLLNTIKANPPKDQIETQSKWQLGDSAGDAWGYFGLLVGLLVVEWFLRKRWGLV